MDAEDTIVKTSVPTLSRTSSGIRQHIWDHLQVTSSPDGNHLIGVHFKEEYHSHTDISASVSCANEDANQSKEVESNPLLFLDIARGESEYRV